VAPIADGCSFLLSSSFVSSFRSVVEGVRVCLGHHFCPGQHVCPGHHAAEDGRWADRRRSGRPRHGRGLRDRPEIHLTSLDTLKNL